MMNTIFDASKSPARQLHVRRKISLIDIMGVDEAISIIQSDMRHQLAQMILENKDIFWTQSGSCVGHDTIEYGIDVVILTKQELFDIQNIAFASGINHALGYRNNSNM